MGPRRSRLRPEVRMDHQGPRRQPPRLQTHQAPHDEWNWPHQRRQDALSLPNLLRQRRRASAEGQPVTTNLLQYHFGSIMPAKLCHQFAHLD